MDEKSKCDLPYGHFGRLNYDLDEKEWRFGRILGAGAPFQLLQGPQASQPAAKNAKGSHTKGKNYPSVQYAKQIQALLAEYPELEPAADLLPRLLKISEATLDATRLPEPTEGSLLAFADIRSAVLHRSVPVAALTAGEDRTTLRLIIISIHKFGWNLEKSVWLEVPSLQGEETSWPCNGGPIQQIQFSQPIESGEPFLAVLLLAKTLLFRPLIGRKDAKSSTSTLDPNLLYIIGIEQTGGRVHADVGFNPWFTQQVGIVDVAGNWKVLEFETRNLNSVARVLEPPAKSEASRDVSSFDDGWARIAWLLNVDSVAVCTRQTLDVFNTAGENPISVAQVESAIFGAGSWFLDFIVTPGFPDHFLLLTSTHIAVYRALSEGSGNFEIRLKAKVLHHRNPEDISLKLKASQEENAIGLVIFSSASSSITRYRFELDPMGGDVFVQDPIEFTVIGEKAERNSAPIRDLRIQPVEMGSRQRRPADIERMRDRLLGDIQFYHATASFNDGSTKERVLYHHSGTGAELPNALPVPLNTKPVASGSFLRSEHFIVDDDEEVEADLPRTEPVARRTRRMGKQPAQDRLTADLTEVVDGLSSELFGSRTIEDVQADVRAALAERFVDSIPPLRTLSSIAGPEVSVADIEQSSQALDESFLEPPEVITQPTEDVDEGVNAALQLKVSSISLPSVLDLQDELGDGNLISVYDQLVTKWISPLSTEIPGWVRLAKVELARSVAADLVLAGRAIRVYETSEEEPQETQESQGQTQTQAQSWELPVRPGMNSQDTPSSPPMARYPSQPSALPTPSPTGTPSVTTASAHSSNFAAPELSRLSRYTTFSKPAPAVLPRGLRNVLSHWEVGEEPAKYDWMLTFQKLARKDEEEDEGLNEKERMRSLRRAERHLRRQRKEVAQSRAQQIASSQATEIFTASQLSALKTETQPGAIAGSSQTQTQGRSQRAVASQVVPGRFGGRPPPKKKRKQGF